MQQRQPESRVNSFLPRVLRKRGAERQSPFKGLGGRTVEVLAHDILHGGTFDPESILLAGMTYGLDNLLRGNYPGIPCCCTDPVPCVGVCEVRSHAVPGQVPAEVYLAIKANHPGKGCPHLCSENPDPGLYLRPEDSPDFMNRAIGVSSDGCDDTADLPTQLR